MSTLTAYFLSDGFIFATDRYRTTGTPPNTTQIEVEKIFAWPGQPALVASVGHGVIGTETTQQFFGNFIAANPTIGDPSVLADKLRNDIQAARAHNPVEGLIVQFGALAERRGVIVPEYYHITNVYRIDSLGHYADVRATFGCSEEILGNHLKGIAPPNLRAELAKLAARFTPMRFQQSIELGIFNLLVAGTQAGFAHIYEAGLLQPPNSLAEWEGYARYWILQYGAYFEAFKPPGQRSVGGGVTSFAVPWP